MRWRRHAKERGPTLSSDEANSGATTDGAVNGGAAPSGNGAENESEAVAETPAARRADGPAVPEEEPRGAHARKGGLVLADEPRGGHVMKGDPLLSVEGRALHAKRDGGEALSEASSARIAAPVLGAPLPPVEEVERITAPDDSQGRQTDSPVTKRRTARSKKRKARTSERQDAQATASRVLPPTHRS